MFSSTSLETNMMDVSNNNKNSSSSNTNNNPKNKKKKESPNESPMFSLFVDQIRDSNSKFQIQVSMEPLLATITDQVVNVISSLLEAASLSQPNSSADRQKINIRLNKANINSDNSNSIKDDQNGESIISSNTVDVDSEDSLLILNRMIDLLNLSKTEITFRWPSSITVKGLTMPLPSLESSVEVSAWFYQYDPDNISHHTRSLLDLWKDTPNNLFFFGSSFVGELVKIFLIQSGAVEQQQQQGDSMTSSPSATLIGAFSDMLMNKIKAILMIFTPFIRLLRSNRKRR